VPNAGVAVEVWTASADQLLPLAGCLSADERARAARLRMAAARASFVAGRVLLRRVLGSRLGCPPEALRFTLRPGGKPVAEGGGDLEFSLSHSAWVVLVAVTQAVPVGVDVERVRPLPEAETIAAAYFPPEERAAYLRLPVPRPEAAFFRLWTGLEARVKATGCGWQAGRPSARGALHSWRPRPGYVAAVAVSGGENLAVRLRDEGGLPTAGLFIVRHRPM
jgi:4'-phosphopantetheinyl transferase